MENMLNKFRSTMSSAASNAVSNAVSIASQVSNYLPGNPVTREFEATSHVASAGTGLSWKVYSGYKKSNRQDVSLFVFEKRSLDRWERQDRELMLEILRRGVAQLTRIRHPQVLTVQHPLEESRDSLAFATEPVLASLANILGSSTHNMPSPLPEALQGYKLHDVEIKYGFVQVCEALQFLHQSVKAVHCCVSPDTVVVNQQGAWKLFGFDFCLLNTAAPDAQPSWQFPEYRSSLPSACLPPLEYLAPECITAVSPVGPASDLFSVGVLMTAVFNGGRPYTAHKGDIEGYKRAWAELARVSSHQLTGVPDGLREQTRQMLQPRPDQRPNAQQLSQIDYFCDIGVKTLSYLDQMFQWDNVQKSQFYKGLPQLIPQLPHRVALLRMVPALVQESVNPSMVPFVLPVVLQVAERATDQEYVDHILPHLKPIMAITEPIQVLVQLMQQMSLLLSKTPASSVRSDLLPLLYRALDTDTVSLQELCLSALPACAKLLDKQTMKAQLLPRVQKLCLATTSLSVRVSCLVCVGRVLPQLDKWLVLDGVVPFITQLPSREAPVIMAAVGILQVSLKCSSLGLTKEVMANTLLPFLLPLSIENCLSPQQHATLLALVRDMLDRVEAEHKTKLEYLNSIKDEQKTLQQMMPEATSNGSSNAQTPSSTSTELDSVFSGLGLGQYVSPSHGGKSNGVGHKAPAVGPIGGRESVMSPTSMTTSRMSSLTSPPSSARDLTASLAASPLPPPPQPSGIRLTPAQSLARGGGGGLSSPPFGQTSSGGSLHNSASFRSLTSPTSPNSAVSMSNSTSSSSSINVAFNANFTAMQNNSNPIAAVNQNFTKPSSISATSTSAFDSLLPTPPKPKPMNQMTLGGGRMSLGSNMISPLYQPAVTQSSWSNVQGFNAQANTMTTGNVNNMGRCAPNNIGVMNANNIGIGGGVSSMAMNNVNTMGLNNLNSMGMTLNNSSMKTMNTMMSPLQPLSLSGVRNRNTSSNCSFQPLSSSDINDLLS